MVEHVGLEVSAPCTALPPLRGTVEHQGSLADFIWFRTGGPAEWLVRPDDVQSLAAFLERPADEPLWSAITHAMLAPLEAEGAAGVRPTPDELIVLRDLLSARDLRAALTKDLFTDWVEAIARRTGTDPVRDMYPRLVAAVVRVVGETAMEAYANADPPVVFTELLRRGYADVSAGLPEPTPRRTR